VSNSSSFARRGGSSLAVPVGDVLGEYATYLEAQKVVDALAKADFAVKGLAIVGSGLTSVELVTGRLSYGRAALTGSASGAWLGLFVGLLLVLFSPTPEFSFLFAAGFIGAGFGMIFGIVSYAVSRRRRDFRSSSHVLAGNYRVIVDPAQTARARQALAGGTVWPPPLEQTVEQTVASPGEQASEQPVGQTPEQTLEQVPEQLVELGREEAPAERADQMSRKPADAASEEPSAR